MGAITHELSAKAGRVLALEVDQELATRLSKEFAGNETEHHARAVESSIVDSNVEIETVDVLSFDFAAASVAAGQRLIVAGNLPYYITSPILLKLAENSDVLDRAVPMVQREVADRVAAQPGSRDYGLLSVAVQLHLAGLWSGCSHCRRARSRRRRRCTRRCFAGGLLHAFRNWK